MRVKVISSALVAAISFSTLAPSVYATPSLNNQMNDIKDKQTGVQAEKEQLQEKLKMTRDKKEDAEEELKKTQAALNDTKTKISAVYGEISKLEDELDQLKKEIDELNVRIERRTEILKDRLVSLQRSGGRVNILDVMLGAESFANLVDRLHAVSLIMKSDQEILREQELDQAALEKKTIEQKQRLTSVEKKKKQLEKLNKELQSQSEKQKELMKQLNKEEKKIEGYLMDADEEARVLAQQEATVKRAIEEAKRRAEEEEKRKQEALANQNNNSNNNSNNNNNNNNNDNNSDSGQKPPISSGSFTRPAAGPVTSEFGARWGASHYGIDIGRRGSNVPVVAAADGVVSSSYFSSSYGNVVFISHYVNGKTLTTVYSHMENRAVSAGQSVSKGDFLGYMGNTGFSTGPHLHFEIHEGEWNNSKSNAVNPRKYINF